MAGKTSVSISKIGVKSIFDDKFKAKAVAVMQKAAERAVKASGKLTLDKPERGSNSWVIDGSLTSLAPSKDGKKLEGKASLSISSSKAGIKAMPSGNAATAIAGADKVDPGDVEAIAEACVESAMKAAVKYMEANQP